MLKYGCILLALMSLSCAPMSGRSRMTYFGFSLGIESAPPPPAIIFDSEPDMVLVPGTDVYCLERGDYDLFRCSGAWYLASRGYWYRSDDYNGRYVAVDPRSVPEAIYSVPQGRWRHSHPRWEDRDRDRDRDHDRGRDHDRDRDHDHDRDHDWNGP